MTELREESESIGDDPEVNELTLSQEEKGFDDDEGEGEESLPPE